MQRPTCLQTQEFYKITKQKAIIYIKMPVGLKNLKNNKKDNLVIQINIFYDINPFTM